jgi:hypothetical protein
MFVSYVILALSALLSIGAFYYYSKEKKVIREFIQHSRRHTYHKELDAAMQKKAGRYLMLSIGFFLICVFVLVQAFIELY